MRVLVLNWKGDCKNALSSENIANNNFHHLFNLKFDNEIIKLQKEVLKKWNSIKILNQTSLITRDANIDLQVTHEQPILINEFYPIKLKLTNKEEFSIDNLK